MTNRKEQLNNIKTDQILTSSLNKTLKPREWSTLSIKYLSPVKQRQQKLNEDERAIKKANSKHSIDRDTLSQSNNSTVEGGKARACAHTHTHTHTHKMEKFQIFTVISQEMVN